MFASNFLCSSGDILDKLNLEVFVVCVISSIWS